MERHVRERGEHAQELRDYVGTLVKVVAVDFGVYLFRVVESGATVQNSDDFELQKPFPKHVITFL